MEGYDVVDPKEDEVFGSLLQPAHHQTDVEHETLKANTKITPSPWERGKARLLGRYSSQVTGCLALCAAHLVAQGEAKNDF